MTIRETPSCASRPHARDEADAERTCGDLDPHPIRIEHEEGEVAGHIAVFLRSEVDARATADTAFMSGIDLGAGVDLEG
jgi:hypothetical protein